MSTINQIENLYNTDVKISFKNHDDRFPMIGQFVKLKDHEHLSKKGMVRFVNQSRLDHFDKNEPQVGLTKIFVASDFSVISILHGESKE